MRDISYLKMEEECFHTKQKEKMSIKENPNNIETIVTLLEK